MEKVDVLICGSGSAGLSAATWLARYGIRCKILERRDGPMKMGQADGVQCRTVEIFESFGVGEELLREAYHVLEVNFWADDGSGVIKRTGRTADTQPGLSHQPHVILNQARINGLLIELMHKYNDQQIDYGYDVTDVRVDDASAGDMDAYPVTVTAEKNGKTESFQAKYALACDGAHSIVRKALGYKMIGDSSDAVWGVMDMIPRTNFPDFRKKSSIRSKAGILLIIPREGDSNNLTRFYIELAPGTNPKEVTLENLQDQAKKILQPYNIEFPETVWWSAYAIGQRHADVFHKDYRVFLAGDACHTHSPKAGQGMNVSLQDGYNIGWKLGEVLTGLASPSILETYVLEREKTAIDLINFDRYWSKLFSSGANNTPAEFQDGFIKAGKYTAGLTARYDVSSITSSFQGTNLASNVVVGMRLPSAQIVRVCDSKPLQLMKTLKSDGRWRVMIFAGDLSVADNQTRLNKIGEYFSSPNGPTRTFTPPSQDADSLIETLIIGHGKRHDVELDQIPECFYPVVGKNQTRDLHKIYYDDESHNQGHGHAYEFLGIDPSHGAIIIARPDQYVSAVLGLDQYEETGNFFQGFLHPQTNTGNEAAGFAESKFRAPYVGGVYKDESESTASLIDVDSPHVQTVESDFLEQDVQTTTQAERLEREAAEAEQRRVREAAEKKAKARKGKSSGLGPNSDNPVYITNAVIGTLVGAGLGFGAYRKHVEGKLSWELVGLVSGAVGAFGVVDYFVSKWFLQNKYPAK